MTIIRVRKIKSNDIRPKKVFDINEKNYYITIDYFNGGIINTNHCNFKKNI